MSGSRRTVGIRVSAEGADAARMELEKLGAVGSAVFNRVADASGKAGTPTRELGDSTKQAAFQMRALAQQMPDVVQGILTGQSAFMLLVQQGGQVVQVTGGIGAAFRTLVSYMGGPYVAAGLAAAGALGVLAARSADLTAEQRQLDVVLRGVGKSAEIGAAGLTAYTRALERQGVARDDARKITADLARTQGLSATNAGRVATLAPDLAAVLGIDAPAAAKQLGDAASGGYDALKKLDDALNFLSADQRTAIRVMLEHGEKTKAVGLAFDALGKQIDGARKNSMSPMGEALNDLKNNWTAFMDEVAQSAPVIQAVKLLNESVQGLGLMVSGGAARAPAQPGDTQDDTAASLFARQQVLQRRYAELQNDPASSPRRAQLPALEAQIGQLGQQITALRSQRDQLRAAAASSPTVQPAGVPTGEPSVSEAERQRNIVDEMTLSLAEQQRIMRAGLPARAAVRAAIQAEKEAREKGLSADAAAELKKRRIAEATLVAGDAAAQSAAAITREGQAALALVAASDQGRAAMLRARAAAEAHEQAATQTGVAEGALATAILNRNAAQEAAKGADVVVGLKEQIAATQALIAAEEGGARPAYWAALDQRIQDATKELRAHRDAATDSGVKAALDNEIQLVGELTRAQEEQNQALALKREITTDRDSIEMLKREIELVGESASVRDRELATLKAIQTLRGRGADTDNLTPEQRAYIEDKKRLADTASELRKQQNLYTELGNIGANAMDRIGDAAVNALFAGEGKAIQFGNVLRSVAVSAAADFGKLALINPLANWAFGGDRASIFSAGAGGSGALGGLGGIGNLLGLGDLFGSGGISGALGLSGSGGLFAGLGTSIFGSAGTAMGPLGEIVGASSGMFGLGGTSLMGGSALTLGGALGGIGGGFGAGMLLNGLLGGNQTGGMIGSGLGAGLGFLVGGPLGGLLGGALGGAGGGLFGPGESVKGYGLRLQSSGYNPNAGEYYAPGDSLLPIDYRYYNDSGAAVFQQAEQMVAAVNAYLAQQGIQVGGASILAGNKNSAGSLADAFAGLRFSAKDNAQLTGYLSGQSFDDPAKLQAAVDGFKAAQAAIEALTAEAVPAFTAQLKAVNDNFDAATEQARKYGLAEDGLATARTKALAELEASRAETLRQLDASLAVRRLTAAGDTQGAALAQQAEAATRELDSFTKSMDALAITAAEKSAYLVTLEETQAAERAAIIKRYGEQANADLTAGQSLLRDLAFGAGSALAPEQKYFAALSTLNQAKQSLDAGGSLAQYSAVAAQVLPVARDYLGTSQRYAGLAAEVGQVLASKGADSAGLSSILSAQVDGMSDMQTTFAAYGDLQVNALKGLRADFQRLAATVEALITRRSAA